MKSVLISSFDLEVGGVERSMISMLKNFDYQNYDVDVMLYSHTGDFMSLLPTNPNLLRELLPYKTFRLSIGETLKKGQISLGLVRMFAKYKASKSKSLENGYKQMQYMWKYSLPFLPRLEKEYDVAISYLWPHYFIANKVTAKTKIAWIHTDFSTVDTDVNMDLEMWDQYHHLVAVSEECKNSFINKYPNLAKKVVVIENITSPDMVINLANHKIDNPMELDKRFKVITVARLSHAKGVDNAVKALKRLKDKGYNDIVWYVVGYGGDEKIVRDLIKENELEDQFILLGKKINPYPFIKAADLYVQPSRYEGKAVTVGEAQILNKPVVITNYTTAKSQVKDGLNGTICEMSTEGIANGIELMFNNLPLREMLSNNCRNFNFSNKNELKKLYKIIS
ncbi:glycosyltransferase [Halalkalibacter akibai]|uniref:Capsular polysaccharide biosynthesis protein n=1 Tax=Halalkalibacter akibai (strain ATCC 43226 / DSM 21942 / CIP 109018 / JCM 9157 / 1139) TaxID=1236973 RepID=W4QVM5_HALA3|nr:glycosyltransferase [Halalkalibacter akibai]GAE35927.1 capsular polysaccharide biosynthesis protein [Halalkalibacter akibai JCM 9157]